MNNGKVIAIAGNQSTCGDTMAALCKAGYDVAYLLHMDATHAPVIADYQDLTPLANKLGIKVVHPATYAMKDTASRDQFDGMDIDLLVSAGWQRLFPLWFLDSLSIGAFGMHGSAEHLPRGRGRSPMNWSLIEGRDRFYTNLFKYDAGMDSGKVIGTQRFDVTGRDVIQSLRHKNTLSQIRLLLDHLPGLLTGKTVFAPQPEDVEPTYYPKRTPQDGVLDWREPVQRIDRLIRGISRPYPGAFTHFDNQRVNIWAGIPFDSHILFEDAAPGEVVATFLDGTFTVNCADKAYYVMDWDSPDDWAPEQGALFKSEHNASWDKLASMHGETGHTGYSFTLTQYSDLLDALATASYSCAFFDEEPHEDYAVFLRHDVDKSVDMALEMARLEHDRGVQSTYFFLIRGALYNLMEPEISRAVENIAALGHKIGLHCDLSRIPGGYDDIDVAVLSELAVFDAICPVAANRMVTFHNPPADVINRTPKTDGYISGYDPRFMLPRTKYISESNANWREGWPADMIRSKEWSRLQILIHPLWWAWDVPRKPTDILQEVLRNKEVDLDRYLRASNHMWQTFSLNKDKK